MSCGSPHTASTAAAADTLQAPSRHSSRPEQRAVKPHDKGCSALGSHVAAAGADEGSSHAATSTRAPAELGAERRMGVEAQAEESVMEAKDAEAEGKKAKPRSALPGICHHGRQRTRCKECDGSGVCEHQRLRHYCKQCGGSGICAHGRRKSDCKECRGSSICEHGKQKRQCRECLAAFGACEHGKAKNRYCKQCGNMPVSSQSSRAKPTFHTTFTKINHSANDEHVVVAACAAAAAPVPEFAAALAAAAPLMDAMQLNQMLQSRLPLAGFGLPSAAPLNPMLMTSLLPVPLAMQAQESFNLNLLLARAHYASLSQQQALQQARYLLQQQPLAPLTVLAPGPSLGLLLGQRFAQPPGQQLQQPTSASQLAANAFAPFR